MAIDASQRRFASTRHDRQGGFALLIAVIFMTVMLAFGLTLGSLGYKQSVLSSSAVQSQYAFYAADAGLECVLYYDSRGIFKDPPTDLTYDQFSCGNTQPYQGSFSYNDSSPLVDITTMYFGLNNNTQCVQVKVYKYDSPQLLAPLPDGTQPTADTFIFSEGADTKCDATTGRPVPTDRTVARGLQLYY